jgi:hypothetical protein
MTREDYLIIRRTNPTILIYEKYRENYDSSKHGRMLSGQELLTYLPMWRNPRDILDSIIEEYDAKFGVVQLLDRNGQFIKIL